MIKKLIALALVLLMVVPMIASCGDKTNKNDDTVAPADTKGNETSEFANDPLVPVIEEYVEELALTHSFDGKTFTWMGPNGWQSPGIRGDESFEQLDEETGDIQSDAMYYRQRDIEDLFGVDWVNSVPESLTDDESISPAIEAIKQDVLSGMGSYDASYGFQMHTQVLLINDCLLNMEDFTTVDLEREWWLKNIREDYSIGGALYFLTGPIVTSYYQDAFSVVFNKQVAEDYGIEAPYDLVKSGEWTFDKMIEIANKVPSNENGSGAYKYADPDGMATVIAHDVSIMKFDEEGLPYLEDNITTEFSNIADKFSKIFSDDTETVQTKKGESFEEKYGHENMSQMFEADEILFLFIPTDEAAWLRTLDVEFGILPMPKGSASQENYVSYATNRSAFNVFVPKSVKNAEMTDVIFEAMAALGYKYFKPVFYENLLKSRSTYDRDSKEMIDIIFDTKRYDMIDVLDHGASTSGSGAMVSLISDAIEVSSEGFVTKYFLQSKIVNGNIKSILANIDADR